MTKIVTRMVAAAAAMSFVATPIVAQANTRAGDSEATYSVANPGPGLGRDAEGEGQAQGGLIWLVVGIGAVTAAVYAGLIASGVIEEGDGECISPGACD
ncbi:MAG: hypothetical protein NBV68_06015 [Erythrobacter sp.]|uniref:hypothetical protein n=1 Tax=Erythrobacter sp. TaxID=1042 RepID=UPI0025EAE6C3|nr:hypothetical protein [Erythrobacter sp.]MCL9998917.1 hypothetical protein [Erythrobacter sp.]